MAAWQPEIDAVVALVLVALREADADDDDIGVAGERNGLGDQVVVDDVRPVVAGRVVQGVRCQQGAQLGPQILKAGGPHLRAARALVARLLRHAADEGDAFTREQRQRVVDVAAQDGGLPGDPAGQGVVGVDVDGCRVVPDRRGGQRQLHQPGGRGVQHGLVERAGVDRLDEEAVGGIRDAGHLQVAPSGECRDPVGHRPPIGDDDPAEAPLLAEHLGEQPAVHRGVLAVQLVVSAHHGERLRLPHGVLEGGELELSQRAFVVDAVHDQPPGLLVVAGEVLQRRAHATGLHAADEGRGHPPRQEGILREVLEVATAAGIAFEVHPRAQQDVDPQCKALVAECCADLLEQRGIPRRRQRGGRGEAGRGHRVVEPGSVVGAAGQPHAVRPVGQGEGRDAGPLDGLGVPEVPAGAQRGLLLERHPGDDARC